MFPKDVKPNFINASWIHSEIKGKPRMIATQGPVPESVGHFWRMVFQERSPLIVMLCNIKEHDRIKCEKYWPQLEETKQFTDLKVTMILEEKLLPGVIGRNFRINCGDEEHTTSQLHYTQWPDFGIPDKAGTNAFLGIVQKMLEFRKTETQKPIITHCSAGVGRTELFEILEEQQGEIKSKDQYFSIFGMVRRLRQMRTMMVQSEEQYFFIYNVLKKELFKRIKEEEKGKY